jgi:predicted RNA-binding Zn ribbon-like protein
MSERDQALAFANTRLDRPSGLVDMLRDRDEAAHWLAGQLGFVTRAGLRQREHDQLLAFRDAVRALIHARSAGLKPPPESLAAINRASAETPTTAQLTPGWQQKRAFSSTGSDHPANLAELRAALANATVDLLADPRADLAECAADDCVVLFLRTDPRRRWHSERCGNRTRAARSYARRLAPGTGPTTSP